ncbi:MAG: excisionase family DNA-binding protein [Actinomycetes bacterium]
MRCRIVPVVPPDRRDFGGRSCSVGGPLDSGISSKQHARRRQRRRGELRERASRPPSDPGWGLEARCLRSWGPHPSPRGTTLPIRLLTVRQMAEETGLPLRYAKRLVDDRRVPVYKVGRRVFVDAQELQRYLASCAE